MLTQAVVARGRTDANDRLTEAEEPLAGLQQRCGGELPGVVAVPELLEAVRRARKQGLRLARSIEALDGEETVRAWVEIEPELAGDAGGCLIVISAWSTRLRQAGSDEDAEARRVQIDRAVAELTARVTSDQRVMAVETSAHDLVRLAAEMRENPQAPWTDLVALPDLPDDQPLHWRLLDRARCVVAGSTRGWTATLVPIDHPESDGGGFELLLVADSPMPNQEAMPAEQAHATPSFGRELTPMLRRPVARIVGNADTIRAQLAGPLADEYSNYAADIAAAGQHLSSLIEDLADIETLEADDFTTASDRIDLAEAGRRAASIIGVRARERDTVLESPPAEASAPAIGEFRRVLQILLNLVGNAIAYSPSGSTVRILTSQESGRARLVVVDNGPGIPPDKAQLVFDKFERLGRGDDGGSGLGLYIARRLARAMGGDLTLDSTGGEGARFTLDLPAAD